jgi:putative peptidoglycan lipid II flippase
VSVGRDIGRASALLLAGTAGVQAIAFARALLIARYFGTGPGLDAYYAALTLPSLAAAVVMIAVEASLLPLYLHRRQSAGAEAAERLYGRCFAAILAALLAVSAALAAGSGVWIRLLAPGFDGARQELAARLLSVGAFQIALGGAADLLATLYLAHRRFAMPVTAPMVGSVVSFAVLAAGGGRGPLILPVSLLAGAAIQVLLLVAGLPSTGVRLRLRGRGPEAPAIPAPSAGGGPGATASLLTLVGSAALANSHTAVDRIFASTCPSGSVAALGYGLNLSVVPSQLFIKTVDSAVFPFLSQQAAEGRTAEVRATFLRAVRLTLVLVAPAMAAVLVLAPEAVSLLFERGSFDAASTAAVAAAWRVYTLGLAFKTFSSLTERLLSSCRCTGSLLGTAAIGFAANLGFNAALVPWLSYLGIPFSTSLTALVLALALLATARASLGPLGLRSLAAPLARTLGAALISAAAILLVRAALPGPPLQTLLAAGGAGLAAYALALRLLGPDDLRSLTRLAAQVLPGAGRRASEAAHD